MEGNTGGGTHVFHRNTTYCSPGGGGGSGEGEEEGLHHLQGIQYYQQYTGP